MEPHWNCFCKCYLIYECIYYCVCNNADASVHALSYAQAWSCILANFNQDCGKPVKLLWRNLSPMMWKGDQIMYWFRENRDTFSCVCPKPVKLCYLKIFLVLQLFFMGILWAKQFFPFTAWLIFKVNQTCTLSCLSAAVFLSHVQPLGTQHHGDLEGTPQELYNTWEVIHLATKW